MSKEQMKTSIGGQAVIEGVMMRGPEKTAMAVRQPNGEIALELWAGSSPTAWYKNTPFIRGMFNFIDMMKLGYKCLMKSAELSGIDMEDEGEALPVPSGVGQLAKESEDDIITLVDVDFAEYRRKNDLRTVRRNVSLPSWLNAEAERAGVNVSAILQTALKQELGLMGR